MECSLMAQVVRLSMICIVSNWVMRSRLYSEHSMLMFSINQLARYCIGQNQVTDTTIGPPANLPVRQRRLRHVFSS